MINQNLHRQPAALDSAAHRQLKLRLPVTDWSVANRLNAVVVAASEFGEACREYPVVFVKAGKEPDGTDAIAPIAMLGLTQNDNLFVADKAWRARYQPALLRVYPFCIARIDASQFAICVDMAYAEGGAEDGQPLFTPEGQLTELTQNLQKQLEQQEADIQRTRLVGKRLLELGVLQDMRFDATLPDGRQHTVDGFLTVDDKKMTELSDAVIGELHRSGILGLVHLHWSSLGNVRTLLEWHVQRHAVAPPAASAEPAA